jgi:hypothetical protein
LERAVNVTTHTEVVIRGPSYSFTISGFFSGLGSFGQLLLAAYAAHAAGR